MLKGFITEKEFAELCGIKLPGLRARRRKEKDIARYKIGRKTFYKIVDVNTFIESTKVEKK
jgi:hypothetical protein